MSDSASVITSEIREGKRHFRRAAHAHARPGRKLSDAVSALRMYLCMFLSNYIYKLSKFMYFVLNSRPFNFITGRFHQYRSCIRLKRDSTCLIEGGTCVPL
jgi:hypothetical protein